MGLPPASTGVSAPLDVPRTTGARFGFIDLLRGFALVVMIETHVVNAYLPSAMKNSQPYFWLTFFNGLVAPTFLFASGFSVMLQANRMWDKWLGFSAPFWKQMRRLGFIALVGYYGHLSYFELSKFLAPQPPEVWLNTLQVDILQSIVASLLIVHVLIFLFRDRDRLAWAAAGLSIAVALLTPTVWAHDFRKWLPVFFALFLNPHGKSLFPLFPWLTFLLCGVVAARLFLRSVERGGQAAFMRWLAIAGALAVAAGYWGRYVPWTLPGRVHYFVTSPLYVMLRLGCVALICALLWVWERSGKAIPHIVRIAGQESLLVYAVHLWLIYAVMRGQHLGPLLGPQHGWVWSIAVSAGLIVGMLALARLWRRLKRDYPRYTRWSVAAGTAFMVLLFVLR